MKLRIIQSIGGLFSLALFAFSANVYAGGAGGCAYSNHMASADLQAPLVPADSDSEAIDPKWLLLLEQQNESSADAPAPIIHN